MCRNEKLLLDEESSTYYKGPLCFTGSLDSAIELYVSSWCEDCVIYICVVISSLSVYVSAALQLTFVYWCWDSVLNWLELTELQRLCCVSLVLRFARLCVCYHNRAVFTSTP